MFKSKLYHYVDTASKKEIDAYITGINKASKAVKVKMRDFKKEIMNEAMSRKINHEAWKKLDTKRKEIIAEINKIGLPNVKISDINVGTFSGILNCKNELASPMAYKEEIYTVMESMDELTEEIDNELETKDHILMAKFGIKSYLIPDSSMKAIDKEASELMKKAGDEWVKKAKQHNSKGFKGEKHDDLYMHCLFRIFKHSPKECELTLRLRYPMKTEKNEWEYSSIDKVKKITLPEEVVFLARYKKDIREFEVKEMVSFHREVEKYKKEIIKY